MVNKLKVLLILAGVGLLVFANSLHNSFLIDDHAFFTGQQVTWGTLFSDFIPDVHLTTAAADDGADIHYYRPMAHLVPMLSYGLFGNNVAGHHLFNLILWVLAAWMVFVFVSAFSKDSVLALAVALFYMLHPINGVLVNYITADVFSFQVICMLASLWFLMKNRYILSILLFILSLLCHETAMALPFYATALFVTLRKQTWLQAVKSARYLWGTLIGYFIWRLIFASLAGGILGKFLAYHMNIFEYAATLGDLILWYISKLVFPLGIIMIKAIPVQRELTGILLGLAALSFLVGVWILLEKRSRRGSLTSLGLWWFAFGFLPFCFACLFRPAFGMMIEPHWFVFPVIGFFIWLLYTLQSICKQTLFKPVLLSLGLCLAIISFVMNTKWDGDLDYCQYWVNQSPGFSAPSFYMAMANEGIQNYDQAAFWYKQVLNQGQYRPEVIYTGLGYTQLMENHLSEATSYLNKALEIDPDNANALGDLGIVAFKQEDYPKARQYFLKAIDLDPYALFPRLNLGKALLKMGNTDEAINAFEGALSVHPESKAAVQELAMVGMAAQKNADMKTATYVYHLLMKYAPNGI